MSNARKQHRARRGAHLHSRTHAHACLRMYYTGCELCNYASSPCVARRTLPKAQRDASLCGWLWLIPTASAQSSSTTSWSCERLLTWMLLCGRESKIRSRCVCNSVISFALHSGCVASPSGRMITSRHWSWNVDT